MKNRNKTALLLILVMFGCSSVQRALVGVQSEQMMEKDINITVRMQYLLYLPSDYEINKQDLPLIVFLHGSGERGDNLELVKTHGPPKLIEQGLKFPFIIVSPQCPGNTRWSVEHLDVLLDELCSLYRVDEDRIYLTGLSLGGYATWEMAAVYPDRFAAIAPICGGGDPRKADVIKHIPAWVFHGAKDNAVPIKRSQEMVDALKKAGADIKFTVYPEAGHDSWTESYINPELYEWFLKYSKKR